MGRSASSRNIVLTAESTTQLLQPEVFEVPISDQHGDVPTSASDNDANFHQLQELVASMRSRLAAVQVRADRDTVREEELKAAFGLFVQISGQCNALCKSLLAEVGGERGNSAAVDVLAKGKLHGRTGSRASATGVDMSQLGNGERRRRLTPASVQTKRRHSGGEDGGEKRPKTINSAWVAAVREWKACLDELAAAHKLWLTNTYKRHEQFATPEILDALFTDRKSRAQVVSGWMKNFGAYKRMQGQSGIMSQWEAQFQNYEQVSNELAQVTCLLQGFDSGIAPGCRVIKEVIIAPRGDTILEFANTAMDWKPVLRFRVSSHMLAETSPVFASMFSKHAGAHKSQGDAPLCKEDEDVLPPPPTPFTCADGSRILLYRMAQLEDDAESSLTILLHAAHMHNDRVPRDVYFSQFVALAEASLRYRCTSPLELYVEHRWLPQWVHRASDAMPDGLVVVSYAFGLRRLFTTVTKTAILNLVDEGELAGKEWPEGIKERIWAVRCAKMAQVYQTCAKALEEYLVHPPSSLPKSTDGLLADAVDEMVAPTQALSLRAASSPPPPASHTSSLPSLPSISPHPLPSTTHPFSSTPRCPKGSHACDATNLGWLMLLYNSLKILPSFLNTSTLSLPNPSSSASAPARSLSQLLDTLRAIPSPPPPPDHRAGSVCDPAPAFRAAVNDVYNSVSGLTLFEIDGTRHGWALSARHEREPQAVYRVGGSAGRPGGTVDEITAALSGLEIDEEREVTVAMEGLRISEDDDRGERTSTLGAEVLSHEGICMQILQGMDSFGDLHNAAVVNRTMYAVYKRNELELMRNVVRADRKRTAMLLVGDDGEERRVVVDEQKTRRSRQTLSPDVDGYLRRLVQSGPEAPPPPLSPTTSAGVVLGGPGDDYILVEAAANSSSTASPGMAPATTADSVLSDTPIRTSSPAPSSSAISRRSILSRRSTTSSSVNPYFKMTEEEARRILWGEPSPPLSPLLSAPEVKAFRPVSHHVLEVEEDKDTKFGAASGAGGFVVEGKMLVTAGNKQLRVDMDRRIGLA